MRCLSLALLLLAVSDGFGADAEGVAFFESKVRPLLIEKCHSCHGPTVKKPKGGLRLDTKSSWLKGGSNGPAVVPGKPDDSPLIQGVRRDHKEIAAMPPDEPLTKDQIAILTEWVNRGAPAPDDLPASKQKETVEEAKKRWPFTPVPTSVSIPAVKNVNWPASEIDRFLLARMEEKGLSPTVDADRRTLIRRASFDLTGLPPTPHEVDSFLSDDSPAAYERLLDRLLASPRYGERWGRHWLDVVRYADTAGDNSDFPIPQMVKYRDWVIDAVNRDLPYDRFVATQLAGDLLPARDEVEKQSNTIATGYVASARRFGSTVDDYPVHLTIEDTLDNLGRAFLGLTINCARCHDHKFDPISMQDYYGLYGVFRNTRYPWPGIELEQRQRDLVVLGPVDEVARLLNEQAEARKRGDAEIKKLTEERDKEEDKSPRREELTKKLEVRKREIREATARMVPFPTAYAVAELPTVGDVPIQIKGDPSKPGEKAPRHFPQVLGGQTLPREAKGSGRLELATWVASPENPLFARVMVNRVWLHHFGKGIVPTPNDFGKQGTPPTHSELLDYLAREFIQNGWSLKALHKQMMLSRAYRLSSSGVSSNADPNNDLLTRFRRMRLEAEAIRDSLLMVSGELDETRPGPHPFPPEGNWNFTQHNPFRAIYDHHRRGVYLMTQRIQRHPFLALFDGADTSASTGSRVTSTSSLQSLFFLNDPFVHARAQTLAKKLPSEDEAMIDAAYRLLFARPPASGEVEKGRDYLRRAAEISDAGQARESYVRCLFRLNEFVYVD